MTLSSALGNALSGLAVTTRQSDIVATNIANAGNESYGRRELVLSANAIVGGVSVFGTTRHSDPAIIAERRALGARNSASSAIAGFHATAERLLGNPEDAQSLSGRLAALEASLISAASAPDSPQRLSMVAERARDLAAKFNQTTDGLNKSRNEADTAIGRHVATLNASLARIADLNRQIARAGLAGEATPAYLDQRQQLIDRVNAIVPVNIAPRDNGGIALFTNSGAILLDGKAAEIGFTPTFTTTPELSIENGRLSGLTVNGIAVRTGSRNGALMGGELGALFAIRDELAPDLQRQMDAMARDLIERFQDPAVDPSLAAGDPGLFTDGQGAFDPADELGIAGRIYLNANVDPQRGGAVWKLRSGLNATLPNAEGDSRLLVAMETALTAARTPSSGDFGGNPVMFREFLSTVMSDTSQKRLLAEEQAAFTATTFSEILKIELAAGVDTDTELQNLLRIETAYAANARVIQTIDDMMQTLLRIG